MALALARWPRLVAAGRPLHVGPPSWAGHNRWSKVRNVKGPRDAARSRLFQRLSLMLRTAAREGGADPALNSQLANVVEQCRAKNMPKASIEAAIHGALGGSLSPPCPRRDRRQRQPGCSMKPVAPVARLFSWRSSPTTPGGASRTSVSSSPVTGGTGGSAGGRGPGCLPGRGGGGRGGTSTEVHLRDLSPADRAGAFGGFRAAPTLGHHRVLAPGPGDAAGGDAGAGGASPSGPQRLPRHHPPLPQHPIGDGGGGEFGPTNWRAMFRPPPPRHILSPSP
ncbi:translational activator of cytochrome c oxidase 1 isoform X1 [Nyctibius grandis]|uniref:translational activator of cytochrome c oxidase 1 isoform X1 n=1 Tax=Nyctibius grandis TaxID=48427 RepID=UPI0035BC1E30